MGKMTLAPGLSDSPTTHGTSQTPNSPCIFPDHNKMSIREMCKGRAQKQGPPRQAVLGAAAGVLGD